MTEPTQTTVRTRKGNTKKNPPPAYPRPAPPRAQVVPSADDRDKAMTWVVAWGLAAKFIEQFATVEQAAAALEWEAVKLERKISSYPVAASGEREYRSWGIVTND